MWLCDVLKMCKSKRSDCTGEFPEHRERLSSEVRQQDLNLDFRPAGARYSSHILQRSLVASFPLCSPHQNHIRGVALWPHMSVDSARLLECGSSLCPCPACGVEQVTWLLCPTFCSLMAIPATGWSCGNHSVNALEVCLAAQSTRQPSLDDCHHHLH